MCGVPLREGGSWSLYFSRPFNDCELDEVHKFFLGLNGKRVQQEVEDRVLWRETKCRKFFVKSLYKALISSPPVSFPLTIIWKVCVQSRVGFFLVGSIVGKSSYFGPTSEERMTSNEKMLPLPKARRINRSHSSSLCQGKDSLGMAFLSF